MGILSDFFVASDEELASLNLADLPEYTDEMKVLSLRNMLQHTFELLLSFASDRDFDEVLESPDCSTMIQDGGDDGPWTVRASKLAVEQLAAISDAKLPEIAAKWSEEDSGNDSESEEYEASLRDIREVARAAQASGRGLDLWTSL